MPKPAYRTIYDGRESYRRDVWVDKKWLGYWYFLKNEDADHFVRGWLERQYGPDKKFAVMVGDRNSAQQQWETFTGIERPHDL